MRNFERIRSRAAARRLGTYLGERIGKGLCEVQSNLSVANNPGATVRGDINTALQALGNLMDATTAPATTYKNLLWADRTTNTLKRRNAANTSWIVVRTLDETFVLSRSSNTMLGFSDIGKVIRATGTFTQTFDAVATLGDGWTVWVINEGSGVITFDPNASETIAGQTTLAFQPGESGQICCNGASLQIINRSRYSGAIAVGRNIAARTDATTPASKFDITADELQLSDGSGGVFVAKTVSVVVDMAASGANGLDTGAEASSTWYYGWVIAKPDGTVAGLASVSSSAPTMPAGYTFKALVTAVRNDGSSNFVKYRQFGNEVWYEAAITALSGGTATTETAVSISAIIPPNALQFSYGCGAAATTDGAGNWNTTLHLRVVSGSEFFVPSLQVKTNAISSAQTIPMFTGVMPNIGQNFYYFNGTSAGSSGSMTVVIFGFKLPGGGE